MQFAREVLTPELLAEMLPLLVAHWREIAHYPDIPLEVDSDVYLGAEERGALRVYTARGMRLHPEAEGLGAVEHQVLFGYAVFFVRPNPHYASSVQAVQDVIYVSPTHRGGAGATLISFAEQQLRDEGVQAVYHHVKLAHAALGKVLERMGYEPVETIYAKRLDRE